MKKIFCIIITLAGCFSSLYSQTLLPEREAYITKVYYDGKAIKELTIETNNGEHFTISIPKKMALSIYSDKEIINKDKDLQPIEFGGKLSIRTKPFSELKDGSIEPQMIENTNRIDLINANVKVVLSKE